MESKEGGTSSLISVLGSVLGSEDFSKFNEVMKELRLLEKTRD
jgi:hypothetical protein